jgi:hypothetical protein
VLASGAVWVAGAYPPATTVALVVVAAAAAIAVVLAAGPRRPSEPLPADDELPDLRPEGGRIPDQIPLSLDSFRGREMELGELAARHAAGRRARDREPDSLGALLIMMHGRPGTGKSAIAREFAHMITDEYPDGRLYANLGIGGDRRPTGEVLKSFLLALGWPDELPPSPAARARIFRSLLAEKRILIVLDAARDADQVRNLLPTSPGCTVVVTSRRDLSPAVTQRSLLIDVPRYADAMAIVRTAAELPRHAYPVEAARIVAACGSLPIALQAAGERAAETNSLVRVADSLAAPAGRLSALVFHNRNIGARLETEYRRLTDRERTALQRLGLLDSATFLPWLLAPLMDCSNAEAEDLVAKLYAAQFIDVAGADTPSGLARYRFHPLVRLFVRERSATDSGSPDARVRLDQTYLAIIAAACTLTEPGFALERPLPTPHYLEESTIPARVRDYVDEWTRAEYANLVTCVHAAADAEEPGLCWRIAAQLGGYLPAGLDHARTVAAFERATVAADRDGQGRARVAVRVAWGEYLLATERHDQGLAMVRAALTMAPPVHVEAVRAYRVLATALLDAGQAVAAKVEADLGLDQADRLRQRSSGLEQRVADDRRLLELVVAAADAATRPHPGRVVTVQDLAEESADAARFRLALILADLARSRRDWQTATESLSVAHLAARGDSRRQAMVEHRRAHTALSRAEETDASEAVGFVTEAIDRAARVVVAFEDLGCEASATRARLLLTRALLAARLDDEAEAQLKLAGRGPGMPGLLGRTQLAYAEMHLVRGHISDAWTALDGAEGHFRPQQDWAAIAATAALRGRIRDRAGDIASAVELLSTAFDAWRSARDAHSPFVVLRQVSYEVRRRLVTAQATTAGSLDQRLSEQVALTQRAFQQADIELTRGEEPELLWPGPVWVATEPNPTGAEVTRFERFLGAEGVAHFVHVGPIAPGGVEALDALRLNTQSVVTVRLDALRAAYTDRRMLDFLNELDRSRGPQNTLFDVRNAIEDERWLFGREPMLNTIGTALREDEQILLTGLRKVGKTSLLNILRQRLADGPVCKIDLQMYNRLEEDWPRSLFRKMVTAYDNWAVAAWPGWSFTPTPPRTATQLADDLERRTAVTRRKLIVIFDELERVYPKLDEDLATERWIHGMGALRAMAQGDHRLVALIVADLRAGANRQNDLGKDRTNPFYQFFREVPLPLLDADSVATMTSALGRATGVRTVTDEFHTELYRLTGGHPSLARMIAGGAHLEATGGVMDLGSLQRGLLQPKVTINVDEFFSNLWRMFTDEERAVLSGGDGDSVALRRAYASLREHGILGEDGITIGLLAERIERGWEVP